MYFETDRETTKGVFAQEHIKLLEKFILKQFIEFFKIKILGIQILFDSWENKSITQLNIKIYITDRATI